MIPGAFLSPRALFTLRVSRRGPLEATGKEFVAKIGLNNEKTLQNGAPVFQKFPQDAPNEVKSEQKEATDRWWENLDTSWAARGVF